MLSENFHKIIPGLFLSNSYPASNLSFLKQNKITHIINCDFDRKEKFPEDFKYKHLSMLDDPTFSLVPVIEEAYIFIEDALKSKGVILVFCNVCVSKSVTIIIAYLVVKYKMSFERAFEKVKRVRKIASPNLGFINQLKILDGSLKPTSPEHLSCSCSIF